MGLPTTIDKIEDEERRLNCKFPETIRQMLLLNNGGSECTTPVWENEIWYLYAVRDSSSKKHLTRSAIHIEKETESAREWYGFPINGVALGQNGGGDILIMLRGSDAIYVWDHETGETIETKIFPIST